MLAEGSGDAVVGGGVFVVVVVGVVVVALVEEAVWDVMDVFVVVAVVAVVVVGQLLGSPGTRMHSALNATHTSISGLTLAKSNGS